jgi:nitrate/nitrite transporter NarK
MTSYAVCADIGSNNTGTVTGAMIFFGQMGAFFLALMFGKIADLTHSFNYPLFILAFVTLAGHMLWLVIDPTKQVHLHQEAP